MRIVKIIIDDENNYFALGLENSIREYAKSNNLKVKFLTPGVFEQPDIVFASSCWRTQRWRKADYSKSNACVLAIKERPVGQANDKSWILYRTDGQMRLFSLLSEVLPGGRCIYMSDHNALSCREKEIMGYLRRGFSQSQTARVLGLSVKTIHSHKRSVMHKLMINRHHDFLGWLVSQGN